MKHRVAVAAGSIKELIEKLRLYVEGAPSIEGVCHGEVKRDQDILGMLSADDDMAALIEAWR